MGGALSESAATVIRTGSSVVEDLCGEGISVVYEAWHSSSTEAGLRATLPLIGLLSVNKV